MKRLLPVICLLASLTSLGSPLDVVRSRFVDAAVVSYAPEGKITDEFIEVSDWGSANDVLLLQLYMSVHLPDAEVLRLQGLFDAGTGAFTDIDYNDKTRGRWNPTLHITRLYALAKLYKCPSSRWFGDSGLKEILHRGIAFWYDRMPVCPNWWHNDIGVPKKLTTVLLMIRDELSQAEIEGGLKVLERSKFGKTGQNKAWLAGNQLMKGLLIDDADLVEEAKRQIAEEIYVTEEEGVQPDWSFHQHGPQIQFGNYGLCYAEALSFWFRVLDGTPYAFSGEQYDVLSNLMKEGICRSVWKGYMDPSFCGRQNFINGNRGKAFSLAVAQQNLAAIPSFAPEGFDAMAKANLQPDEYANSLVGARYYPRSDCGIYRTAHWYGSIRMHSERTIGFEFTNRENTLGNFSADGALVVMTDGDEYHNIFGHWDWRKVPGVTAYEDGKPIKSDDSAEAKRNNSSHVGGAVLKDIMCSTMELERDGLHALKSAFFFPGAVVNLGADIRVSRDDISLVTTALEQNNLDGEALSGTNWVNHDGKSYVSLDGTPLKVYTGGQEGLWDPIDPFYVDKKSEGDVFKCWFEHNPAEVSSYAYAVIPGVAAADTDAAVAAQKIKVLRNDSACQAVSCGRTKCVVFHQGGSLRCGLRVFRAKSPCIIIVRGWKKAVVEL